MWSIHLCGMSNKLILFMNFCNIIDWDGFVNMSMLKSPAIVVGKLIGILFNVVSKIEVKWDICILCGL